MSSMSIKTFLEVAPRLPRDTAILLRADHGVGKSQVVRQLAAGLGLPLIDRRTSQMSEGDIIGLPSTDGEVTRFNPTDWYLRACREPVCLFLDEMNRGTNEVQQACFQIVLDRELNGHRLHPDTLVVSAVNTGASYTVNEMDPALLDRFWCADLDPTVADWTKWARGKLADVVVDFIITNEKFLDTPKGADLSKVQTSRRSWERLSKAITGAGIDREPTNPLFYAMCVGYVGLEASVKFVDFAKTQDAQFSGEEIMNDYPKVRAKLKKLGSQDQWNSALEKAGDYTVKHLKRLDDVQKKNLRTFGQDLPAELRVALWTVLSKAGVSNLELVRDVHGALGDLVVGAFAKKDGEKAKR